MIQRIQTIWLLLAAMSVSIAYFFPFGTENLIDQYGQAESSLLAQKNSILSTLLLIIAIESIVTIFAFKNRKIQKWLSLSIAVQCIFCIAYMVYIIQFEKSNANFQFGIAAPLLALLFSFLAYIGINKDDKLVKNLDRLR